MEWHKGTICKTTKYDTKPGEKKCIKISYYIGTQHGYHDNDIVVTIKQDGAVSLSDDRVDGGFIYLYPEQVKILIRTLNAKS
jgi:hypothetical protein